MIWHQYTGMYSSAGHIFRGEVDEDFVKYSGEGRKAEVKRGVGTRLSFTIVGAIPTECHSRTHLTLTNNLKRYRWKKLNCRDGFNLIKGQ